MWNFIKELTVGLYWEVETKTGGRTGELLGLLSWAVAAILFIIFGGMV